MKGPLTRGGPNTSSMYFPTLINATRPCFEYLKIRSGYMLFHTYHSYGNTRSLQTFTPEKTHCRLTRALCVYWPHILMTRPTGLTSGWFGFFVIYQCHFKTHGQIFHSSGVVWITFSNLKVHYATFLQAVNKQKEFLMQETVVCRN